MAPRSEHPAALFLTMVVTHSFFLPVQFLLFRRGWHFELYVSAFCFLTSIMYHICQTFQTTILLTELQWHRLDNIGVITAFGIWLVYLCDLHSRQTDQLMKYGCLTIAILSQEDDPWNVAYTLGPIVGFVLLPLVHYSVVRRWQRPDFVRREVLLGLGLLGFGLIGFGLGLDDDNDPYRIFHAVWHVSAGSSLTHIWSMVRHPRRHWKSDAGGITTSDDAGGTSGAETSSYGKIEVV